MTKYVDVAIIGAGSAGLAALSEARKVTNNYVVINDGPLGTLCARGLHALEGFDSSRP